MMTLRELYREGTSLLTWVDEPVLEARVILLKAADISEKTLFLDPDLTVTDEVKDTYFQMLKKRQNHMPLAYITGTQEFWSMLFAVRKGVLIPRPETEGLVEKVTALCPQKNQIIIDVGTGCGNIALSAAKECADSQVVGIDISKQAVDCAQTNASYHKMANVCFIQGDLFEPMDSAGLIKTCGFIVSNPPYVSEQEWLSLDPQIRDHEPKQALVSGERGYEFIRRLVCEAPNYLKPGGHLLFEIGQGQEERVRTFFDETWARIEILNDLAGIPRIFLAQKAS
ncbi:MAG: peptide chain release factor N(5)-glutamine methyltransferase [Candidatus Aminicenantes bacterium]|nr:peptide chain release factor N(5)-glutamine methyltransferase [Candidatus Aminicenantes bacterium]